MDENNTSAELSSHQNLLEVIDHTYDETGINLLNTEEESYVTSIHSINATNNISMYYDDNFIHKYYAPFYHQRIMQRYLLYYNMIQRNE